MNIQDLKTHLDWALYYRGIGWSPIPVKSRDKIPLIEWKKYQAEIASEEQIREWWTRYPDANIGIVTGKVSGIAVVDVEMGGETKDLPPTVMSNTGGGGFHLFYRYPQTIIQNAVRIREKTDIRGDRGYAVVPPSLHKSGKCYSWAIAPEEIAIAEFPEWLLKKASDGNKAKTDWQAFLGNQNLEGTRNQQAAMFAGKLLYEMSIDTWDVIGLPAFQAWNDSKNTPPLSDRKLIVIWESIKKAEMNRRIAGDIKSKKRLGGKVAEKLADLIKNKEKAVFFHNQLKDPFIRIPIGNHMETWSCKSRMLKLWLVKIFWDAYEDTLSSEALKTAINSVESEACFNGVQHALHNRVAWHDGAIWYDLADAEWQVVKITSQGWQVIKDSPILFRRYSHQHAQVEPVKEGNLHTLLKFVNIQDEDQKILLLVWIVSCFIPDFPHPIPNFYGAQGSAKSLLSKLLRKVIDPSGVETISFPKDTNELAQILSHHYCIFFDNVSHLPDNISDALCKAVTGDGFSKRELYTDEDDIIFSFKRPLGINGINIAAKNPDLLERSILFELQRVAPNQRRQESELLKEFEDERPKIIGGIFDAVVRAMQIKPSMNIKNLPRMADFTVWGCAIAEALGYTQRQFLDAYYSSIKSQNTELLSASPMASAIIRLMETVDVWSGTPSELLEKLKGIAEGQGDAAVYEKELPRAATALTRAINRIKTNLADDGIEMKSCIESKHRKIYLWKIGENPLGNGNDGILPIL